MGYFEDSVTGTPAPYWYSDAVRYKYAASASLPSAGSHWRGGFFVN